MSDRRNILTRDALAVGAAVLPIGPWYPADFERCPAGELLAWKESRYGGMFCDVKIAGKVQTFAMTDLVKA